MVKLDYTLQEVEAKLEKDPENADLWYQKGMALSYNEKKYEEAVQAFTTGLIYNPFHAGLRLQRGRKYTTLDDYRTATAEIMLSTRLDPENWDAWYYLGTALYLDGEYAECMKAEKRAMEVMRAHGVEELPCAMSWYWEAAMKLGKKEEADKILELVYEGIPCGNQDYVERLLLQKGLRDPETFLDPANNKDPERPELYYMTTAFGLSDYYTYRGEMEKSNELLKKIAAMDCYHEAFVYKQTKQEMKARGLC